MSDPVADFLAREQDMFAEIEGGDVPAAPAAPVPEPVVEAVQPEAPIAEPGFDVADDFGALAVAADPVSVGGGDSGVDLTGLDAQQAAPVAPVLNGGMLNGGGSTGPSPVPSLPRIEAENIRRWRQEQEVMLQQKDEAEEKKKQDMRSSAIKELDEWYKQREATLKGTKEANRKAEEEHLAAFGREQGESAQWDEIAKLSEAKVQKGGKDVSRMKSMLLQLKEQNTK